MGLSLGDAVVETEFERYFRDKIKEGLMKDWIQNVKSMRSVKNNFEKIYKNAH